MKRGKQKAIVGTGIFFTAVWLFLAALIVLYWSEKCPNAPAESGWVKLYFACRPPNEIGDFLAGIFATLAFIWLMVAVFLQSMELAAQREELELTRAELKEHRKVAQSQVDLIEEQTEIERSKDRARFIMAEAGRSNKLVTYDLTNAAATAFAVEVYYFQDRRFGSQMVEQDKSIRFNLSSGEFENARIFVDFVDRRDRLWRQEFLVASDNSITSSAPIPIKLPRETNHTDSLV